MVQLALHIIHINTDQLSLLADNVVAMSLLIVEEIMETFC